jgi:dienelactone hydrolase
MTTDRDKPSRLKHIWNFLKRAYSRVKVWLLRFIPARRTRKGVVIAVFAAVVLLMAYSGAFILQTGWGVAIDALIGAAIGAVGFAVGSGVVALLLVILGKLPRLFSAALAGALLSILLLVGMFQSASLPLAGGIVFVAALLGGTIAVLTAYEFKIARTAKRVAVIVVLLASVGASVWFFFWLASAGTDEGLVKVEEPTYRPVPPLAAADPSQSGPFRVLTLTYGSGEDRREDFGAKAQIKTPRVDGKPFLTKLDGWLAPIRKGYWGFDWRKLPLNGRVWYPAGEGKFPLVLIVHGNHLMREYSDPGYAYLGELLASRGFISVSVDENFLNGDWSDNYKKENDARGWVMLEHLKVWRGWNEDRSNPFYKKVDIDRISFIGHSRGGEAVAIAAAFNRLQRYPDDARVKFDFGFNIRSIIAIAPIDGQYMPTGRSTPLENINYLVFQGAHDADVSFFSGDRQYKRIKFTDDRYWFKSSLYIYRANHGQFNTVWAERDWGLPHGYLLNVKPLLTGEEQRKIAKVYISAFLDVTLKDQDAYLPLFRDDRVAAEWLPKTYYVNRFEDSRTRIVSDYDEDIDVTTTMVKGGTQSGENLATWKEKDLGLRGTDEKRQNQVVYLGWKYSEHDSSGTGVESARNACGAQKESSSVMSARKLIRPASYAITLPKDLARTWKLDAMSALVFSLAESDEKPAKPDSLDTADEEEGAKADTSKAVKKEKEEPEDKEADKDKPKKPIDFTIEVQDRSGQIAALSLSEIAQLLPPLKAKFTKYAMIEMIENLYGSPSEPVLQTVEVPMTRFLEVTNDSIRQESNRSGSGSTGRHPV